MPSLPPGPTAAPIIQTCQYLRDPFAYLDENAARHGATFTARFFRSPVVVSFNEPEEVREVLALPADRGLAGKANAQLELILGKGSILLLDGKRHERERKLLMPSFHGERVGAYLDQMVTRTEILLAEQAIEEPFSLHDAMQTLTLEIILECVFGMDPGPRRDRLRDLLKRLITLGTRPAVSIASSLLPGTPLREGLVDHVAPLADRLSGRAGLDRLLPFGGVARCVRDVDRMIYEDLAARRAAGTRGRTDVMSMLIEARDDRGVGLEESELRDEMMTLLLAGHETTATTLTFALSQLLASPGDMEAIKLEQERVTGGRPLTAEAIREMRYLDAFIKEVLRLYGPASGFGRVLSEDTKIGNYLLPAGVMASSATYLLHRNPRVYPDPLRFDAARFLDHKPRPGEYIAFGGGLRACIGMAFSLLEIKAVLSTLLARATLRAVPSPPLRMVSRGLVFGPSHGLPAVIEGRHAPRSEGSGPRAASLS